MCKSQLQYNWKGMYSLYKSAVLEIYCSVPVFTC